MDSIETRLGLQRHDRKRHSAPTAPKVTRELKPTPKRANQVRQKAATVAESAGKCFAFVLYLVKYLFAFLLKFCIRYESVLMQLIQDAQSFLYA